MRLPIVENDGSVRHERADAQENRTRILAAARKLIEEKGPGFSMDELAARSGVGKGTLYRRFKDKADLCMAMLSDEAAALQNEIMGAKHLATHRNPLSKIEWFLAENIRLHWPHVELLNSVISDSHLHYSHPGFRWQVETLVMYLDEAVEAGDVKRHATHPLALVILSMQEPGLLSHLKQGGMTCSAAVSLIVGLSKAALRT